MKNEELAYIDKSLKMLKEGMHPYEDESGVIKTSLHKYPNVSRMLINTVELDMYITNLEDRIKEVTSDLRDMYETLEFIENKCTIWKGLGRHNQLIDFIDTKIKGLSRKMLYWRKYFGEGDNKQKTT